jgi:hypothetical protein
VDDYAKNFLGQVSTHLDDKNNQNPVKQAVQDVSKLFRQEKH